MAPNHHPTQTCTLLGRSRFSDLQGDPRIYVVQLQGMDYVDVYCPLSQVLSSKLYLMGPLKDMGIPCNHLATYRHDSGPS
jgi:hypothetical protein